MAPLHIAIVAAVVGLLLLIIGLRGRRVGDHPFCRRCGFDLFGKPDESTICPECGTDLRGPRAYAIGVRHRRRWAIVLSMLVMLPLIGIAGVIGWGTYHGVNWQTYKPVWYLAREADASDVRVRDAALAELLARYAAKKLTRPQVASLIEHGLAAQGDAARPWAAGWGDLIESMQLSGDVSPPQWRRYLEQAVANMYTPRVREKVSINTPLTYRLDKAAARVANRSTLWQAATVVGVEIDGETSRPGVSTASSMPMSMPMSMLNTSNSFGRNVMSTGPLRLPEGPHSGSVDIEVRVMGRRPQIPAILRTPPPAASDAEKRRQWAQDQQKALRAYQTGSDEPALASVNVKLPMTFEVLPPGRSGIEAVDDESLRLAVETAIQIRTARMLGDRQVNFQVSLSQPPPIDLSYSVLIRDAQGREHLVGQIAWQRGASARVPRMLMGTVEGFKPPEDGMVDVIFRPDPAPAGMTPDITRYWNGTVIRRGVPLEDPARRSRLLWDGIQWEQRRKYPDGTTRF